MRNGTYNDMKAAREGIVQAGMSLFRDRLTYGDNTACFEERIVVLLEEFDKIIDDYKNSDICPIEDEEEW